jgi:hypothetical protein
LTTVTTPIAAELAAMANDLRATSIPPSATDLEQIAQRVAKLERFHTAAVADAHDDELLQTPVRSRNDGQIARDFLASFQSTWGLRAN